MRFAQLLQENALRVAGVFWLLRLGQNTNPN